MDKKLYGKTKQCRHCKIKKDSSEFPKNTTSGDGLNTWCKDCNSIYHKEWRLKNSKKRKKYREEYQKKNKERLRRLSKAYRKENRVAIKIGKLAYYYNLSKEEATELYRKKLDGVCDICGKKELSNRFILSVDHNHETGEIRGLLCNYCNRALGYFRDNIDTLKSAIKYLEKRGSYGTR